MTFRFLPFTLLLSAQAMGQTPATTPIAPMDIPLLPAGNFMELRSGHFHSGVDLKTGGVEGVPVKAVKDGFVARLRISPWGYGRAIYLQHADGTTTVYGHLSLFAPVIEKAALDLRYSLKKESIDQAPAQRIEVKQGEVIAFSGNTGGSSAPHLHYEIRNTTDQHALDPEAHGLEIRDNIPPDIMGVRLYPLDSTSRVSPYPGKARGFATRQNGNTFTLDSETVVAASGSIGIAVHTIDRYNGSENKCGVRRIELFVDSTPAFSVDLDEIDFDLNRYCDAHMDFGLYKDQDMHYHRLYKLPNNSLKIYGGEEMQGRITCSPGKQRNVRVVITDANGNSSTLRFSITGATWEQAQGWSVIFHDGIVFHYDKENRFARDDVRLVVPALSLYDDLTFTYHRSAKPKGARSALHTVGDALVPMNKSAELSIRADSVPAALTSKALLLRSDGPGKTAAQGGTWSNGWVTASVRSFGRYTVVIDTVPPKVTSSDLREDMSGRNSFTLRVADNLSGLDSWTATLDGKWIVMDFDPKAKTLTHTFDSYSDGKGKRQFKIVVNDERKNSTVYSFTFTR